MKTVFSRLFTTALLLLLMALLLIGSSFRLLVRNYLVDNAVEKLRKDAAVVSDLAAAYYSDNTTSVMYFLMNLDVASKVSGADAVICNAAGRIVLCSDSPSGCSHQGMQVDESYVKRVIESGSAVDTGVFQNLYEDNRYVVAVPILSGDDQTAVGIVIVSTPIASTTAVMGKISDIYVFVSLLVVVLCGVLMSVFAKRQSAPLLAMSKAASDFGHGNLNARVKTDGKNTREVEELALAFNNMASSLQKSEYQRQEFVTNVSHELKTPMTTISGYVDGILDGTIPEDKREHYLRHPFDESMRCMEDYDILYQIAMDCTRIAYLAKPLYQYRILDSGLVRTPNLEIAYQCFEKSKQRYEALKAVIAHPSRLGICIQAKGFLCKYYICGEPPQWADQANACRRALKTCRKEICTDAKLPLAEKLKLCAIGVSAVGRKYAEQKKGRP